LDRGVVLVDGIIRLDEALSLARKHFSPFAKTPTGVRVKERY
jgi:hypothetical protein